MLESRLRLFHYLPRTTGYNTPLECSCTGQRLAVSTEPINPKIFLCFIILGSNLNLHLLLMFHLRPNGLRNRPLQHTLNEVENRVITLFYQSQQKEKVNSITHVSRFHQNPTQAS